MLTEYVSLSETQGAVKRSHVPSYMREASYTMERVNTWLYPGYLSVRPFMYASTTPPDTANACGIPDISSDTTVQVND